MTMCSGRNIDLLRFTPEDISIPEVAHHLSMLCRYTGATPSFYSVAEHSVIVSRLVKLNKKWGLLHDLAEAYLGDLNPAVRMLAGDKFKKIEKKILRCMAARFDLPLIMPDNVRIADKHAREIEMNCFWNKRYLRLDPKKRIDPLFLNPYGAESSFLNRFEYLFLKGKTNGKQNFVFTGCDIPY